MPLILPFLVRQGPKTRNAKRVFNSICNILSQETILDFSLDNSTWVKHPKLETQTYMRSNGYHEIGTQNRFQIQYIIKKNKNKAFAGHFTRKMKCINNSFHCVTLFLRMSKIIFHHSNIHGWYFFLGGDRVLRMLCVPINQAIPVCP